MVSVLCERVILFRQLVERSRQSTMVNFQILALLAIVFCFTLQSEASPLTLREVETDGEETDREFEDAFEAAMKEEVKREFQFENAHEARSFDEDEEVARTLQDQSSYLDDLQEKAVGKETDRQFENAFDEALNEEMVRIFEDEEEMDVREDDEPQISADFDLTPPRVSEDGQQSEVERQISPDVAGITPPKKVEGLPTVDITPPKKVEGLPTVDTTPPKKVELQIPAVNPRTTQSLRLSRLFIRPVLTKRCQGKTNYSMEHCAKYLSCGTSLFRGAIRTCESGQLFDAVLKKCNASDKVDCKIRT